MPEPTSVPANAWVPLEDREPRDFVEAQITDIWEDVLGSAHLSPHAEFVALGGDSLMAARVISRVNRLFGLRLAVTALFDAATIEQFASLVKSRPDACIAQRIVHIAGQPDAPRFFCVHAQSGELFFLRQMRWSAPHLAIHGIRSVGLEGEESALRSIQEMAQRYVSEVCRVQPEGPYLLGGYCMGGLIAFEMARLLKSHGRQIAMLALLDTDLNSDLSTVDAAAAETLQDVETLMRKLADADAALPQREGGSATGSSTLRAPMDGYWPQVLDELQSRARLAPDIDVALYRQRLSVSAWNTLAAAAYRARPVDIKVDVYASTDFVGSMSSLHEAWSSVAAGGAHLIPVEMSHFDFFYSEVLRRELAIRAQAALKQTS